ncbi:MAG: isochorismatase family protein [Deltaproteobacteria bacterium]|nr:isochorismatase family protein [Deltaproteobacteria bacterium]
MVELEGLLPRDNVVVVLVDIQEKLFPHIDGNEALLTNAQKLVNFCQRLNIPMIVTEQYPKGLGVTLPALQEVLAGAYQPITKTVFSCFGAPEFIEALDAVDADTVVLAGIETHICVLQTALVGVGSEDYDMVVLADCVGSRRRMDHDLGLHRMRDEGAGIATMEMFFYEMLGAAKTEEHKAVFDLLK